jgi:hypothetical protein
VNETRREGNRNRNRNKNRNRNGNDNGDGAVWLGKVVIWSALGMADGCMGRGLGGGGGDGSRKLAS